MTADAWAGAGWQATSSLEDLAEHRRRLKGELDKLHTEVPEPRHDQR